jgi:hypothetical protein
MDVLDAGVFVSSWEAKVPRHTKMHLWGPLQAKELGLEGWEVQDGGETGFVLHNAGVHLTMGRATSTLIFVRRLEKAFLTVYFGGYPTDAPASQRRMDTQGVVAACEMFLGRLAKQPVQFTMRLEQALVDNSEGAKVIEAGEAAPPRARMLGGGARGPIIDAEEKVRPVAREPGKKGKVWEA